MTYGCAVVARLASLSALGLLGACVSSPKLKTPCEVLTRVVLMSPEQAHARCAPGPGESVVSDDGVLMRHTDAGVYGGCAFPKANPPMVIVQDSAEVIAHELRHVFDARCSKE